MTAVPHGAPPPAPLAGTAGALYAELLAALPPAGSAWLARAVATVAVRPQALEALFPAVARHCGRGPWRSADRAAAGPRTVADAARAVLLASVPEHGQALAVRASACYRYGDSSERLAVLRALPLLDVGDAAVGLLDDALRTNDTRMIEAAVGPYAARRLPPGSWRHAVLKCLFTGVPLAAVHGLADRADTELSAMLRSFVAEREAAGRPVPAGVRSLASLAETPLAQGAE